MHTNPNEPGELPAPPRETALAPYRNGEEYLNEELARVDLLLKGYLLRQKSARLTSARDSDFPAACAAVLGSAFRWSDPVIDPDCRAEIDRLSRQAQARHEVILARLRLSAQARSTMRLARLINSFGLALLTADGHRRDTTQLDTLLLALLAERSPRYRAALAEAPSADGSVPGGLTVEVALQVAQPGAPPHGLRWDVFAADRPLLANGLIVLGEAARPAQRPVRIDERIANHLLGKDGLDPALGTAVRAVTKSQDWDALFLDEPTLSLLRRLSAWWWERGRSAARLVLLLHGPPGSPLLPAAHAFLTRPPGAAALLVVDVPAALHGGGDWDTFVGRCHREAALRGSATYWQGAEVLLDPSQPAARWESLVAQAERSPLPTFIASEAAWDPTRLFHAPDRYFVRVQFRPPTAAVRRTIWKQRLGGDHPIVADDCVENRAGLDLLDSFQFTPGQIDDAIATARGLALAARPDDPSPALEHLAEGCRRQSARRLVSFAQRVQPRAELSDLKRVVLPPDASQQLEELAQRMRHLDAVHHRLGFAQRLSLGRGLVALFTGPSGSGKTLAAMLLAGANKKDLYKVDMAAVTSKFVGETEKNLNRVFGDAQDANAVLFFDEADAMFGKRGEVEQAQDRWANLEVNFLLQRIEEYTGTVILATNFRQNIDAAFLRRVQVLINFPLPKPDHRLLILKGMFPETTGDAPAAVLPPGDAQLKTIADRFELSGGSIKNVVLDAAFRSLAGEAGAAAALAEPVRVDQTHLVLGVAREYQKLGKPITIAEFGREFFELVNRELKLGRGA